MCIIVNIQDKQGSSKARTGKEGRKRQRSPDDEGHSKKKSRKDRKPAYEDDGAEHSEQELVEGFQCRYCDAKFLDRKICKYHIKHECPVKEQKKHFGLI